MATEGPEWKRFQSGTTSHLLTWIWFVPGTTDSWTIPQAFSSIFLGQTQRYNPKIGAKSRDFESGDEFVSNHPAVEIILPRRTTMLTMPQPDRESRIQDKLTMR